MKIPKSFHQSKLLFLVLFVAGNLVSSVPSTIIYASAPFVKNRSVPIKNIQGTFIENKGQIVDVNHQPVPYVLFKAEAPELDLYITTKGLTYVFFQLDEEEEQMEKKEKKNGLKIIRGKFERVDVQLIGATIEPHNIKKEMLAGGHKNFFSSNYPDGIYEVKEYAKITIANVYKGIDWVLYNIADEGFKYDFIVHPGADASLIKMKYISEKQTTLNEDGAISINSFKGALTEHAPLSYIQGSLQQVKSNYKLLRDKKIKGLHETLFTFVIEDSQYSKSQTLVIDPQVTWCTLFGGSNLDGPLATETDHLGNVFISGYMGGNDFPVLNAGTYFESGPAGAFIAKFSNTGTRLWVTLYAGCNGISSLALNSVGNLYAYSSGHSSVNGLSVQNSGGYFQGTTGGNNNNMNACILKFNNSGVRMWATFYGGSNVNGDFGTTICCDNNDNIYITGRANSSDFPVHNGGNNFQGNQGNNFTGFLVKFDNNDNRIWASLLQNVNPGKINCDPFNNVYLTGFMILNNSIPLINPGNGAYFQSAIPGQADLGLFKFNSNGALLWSTFYAGTQGGSGAPAQVCDNMGNLYITAVTSSTTLPMNNSGNYFQAPSVNTGNNIYVTRFNANGSLGWGTYFGGTNTESMGSSSDNIDVDSCGNIFISFETLSRNIFLQQPCEGGYFKSFLDTSSHSIVNGNDLFIARFSNAGHLTWATYVGGNGYDVRSPLDLDKQGNLFLSGEWTANGYTMNSSSYPLVNPGGTSYFDQTHNGSDDAFLMRFGKMPHPAHSITYSVTCQNTSTVSPFLSSPFIPGGTYTANAGLNINTSNGIISPSLSTPGTYTVTYMVTTGNNTCSCVPLTTITCSTTVNISSPVNLNVSSSKTVCAGASAILTVSGAATYSWNTGATSQSIVVTPIASMVYTVTGKNESGCNNSHTVQVVVSKCAGVDEISVEKNKWIIYPNPNNGEFNITGKQELELIITNEAGQQIRVLFLNAKNNYSVNISGFSKGIYFIHETGNENSAATKIVVE